MKNDAMENAEAAALRHFLCSGVYEKFSSSSRRKKYARVIFICLIFFFRCVFYSSSSYFFSGCIHECVVACQRLFMMLAHYCYSFSEYLKRKEKTRDVTGKRPT